MKKMFFLTLLLWMCSAAGMTAQVSIGSLTEPHEAALLDLSQSTGDLGLLLPRVRLADVNQFQLRGVTDPAKVASAAGMIVFNTNPNTKGALGVVGEFIWNGKQWRPLAIDSGTIRLNSAGYQGSVGNEIDAENPQASTVSIVNSNCDIAGNYLFSLIAGDEYASVSPASSVTPTFSVSFLPNETGFVRRAIVLVTEPCGKTATFVFSQKAGACSSNIQPAVSTYSNNTLYAGGSVAAYVSALTPASKIDSHNYYWMYNNTLVAEGVGAALTVAGTYFVYADQIGCGTPGTITVTGSNEQAPESKHIIVNNEGVICGPTGTVKLSALNAGNDDIWWFKDGIRQGTAPSDTYELTGESGGGVWHAVAVDKNGRTSAPSNRITVGYQSGGSAIAVPQATVNGFDLTSSGSIVLCAEGTLVLEVTNRNDPSYVNPVFSWYANDQLLGESDGKAIHVISGNLTSVVLSVKATVMGSCPSSATSSEIMVDRVNTPDATIINGGATEAVLCGLQSTLLRAGVQNGTTYEWFKNGDTSPISGANASTYQVSQPGRYSVRYANASGCWSRISPEIQVNQSNVAQLIWIIKPEAEEILSSSKTYSVLATPDILEYQWSITPSNAGTVTPLGNGETALVSYSNATVHPMGVACEIVVTARNGCGEVQLHSGTIQVKEDCIPVAAVVINAAADEINAGESITYTASVNAGTPPYTCEWYLDNNYVSGGDTYTLPSTAQDIGVHSIYVRVKNPCTGSGTASLPVSLKVNINSDLLSPDPPGDIHTIFMEQKTCLDVHQTGDNGTNSWIGERLPLNVRPNDFASLNFTYKFVGSGTGYDVSTVSYSYNDPNRVIADVTGHGTDAAVLKFRPEVVENATGRTKNNPIRVTLYAVYAVNTNLYKDSVNITIQDAACGCPAKLSPTTWKMDMCYTLGADYTQDPFIMQPGIYGDYYKWGRKTPAASYTEQNLNRITSSTAHEWDMVNENPCPRGWRVPRRSELEALSNVQLNPRTAIETKNESGYRGQLRGYVPISGGGNRAAASSDLYLGAIRVNNDCHTWSSDAGSNVNAHERFFPRTSNANSGGHYSKNYGLHVRCISEGGEYTQGN